MCLTLLLQLPLLRQQQQQALKPGNQPCRVAALPALLLLLPLDQQATSHHDQALQQQHSTEVSEVPRHRSRLHQQLWY